MKDFVIIDSIASCTPSKYAAYFKLSLIKVEHLNEIKEIRTKFTTQEDEYIKTVETYRNKNQELLKKIAQISKGKA